MIAAAVHYGLTLPGVPPGIKGAWLMNPPSNLIRARWRKISGPPSSPGSCASSTIAVSMVTKPREEKELVGLVYFADGEAAGAYAAAVGTPGDAGGGGHRRRHHLQHGVLVGGQLWDLTFANREV